ncbi:MAG TPA: adenylate/guanylate cyclase domain-containing protein [Reyranella sp.]|nr:adenylate/guanylate cyclase domain-containing protein [Reyranella sp.]
MEAPRLERRLIAILSADVEGYSRHMERDEVATLATLSSHRVIVDDLVASHSGRITGTAGDSVLAEFQSVVDALDCAMKMQDAIAVASESQPTEHRLLFRIGINVGDVMVKDGDIFGDGVNIAARLETLADPGGICVSRGVRDHVRKMGQYAFLDLGEQSVKNIAQPIRAFRVRSASGETPVQSVEVPATTTLSSAEQHAGDPAEFELAFWEAMKDSKDPAEFEAYLEQYPSGAFTTLAEARLQAVLQEQEAPVEPAATGSDLIAVELAFWDAVKDSDNPEMHEAYLERYPDGAFAALAKVRLTELRGSAP